MPPQELRRKRKEPSVPRVPWRSRRIVTMLLIFAGCVLVVDALVGEKGLLATIRARREYEQLVSDLSRARTENARLREEARRLREDPATIEEIARRELGLIRPGETLFIIKDIQQEELRPPAK